MTTICMYLSVFCAGRFTCVNPFSPYSEPHEVAVITVVVEIGPEELGEA